MSGYKKPIHEYWKTTEKGYPKIINWKVVAGDKRALNRCQSFDYVFNREDAKFFQKVLFY